MRRSSAGQPYHMRAGSDSSCLTAHLTNSWGAPSTRFQNPTDVTLLSGKHDRRCKLGCLSPTDATRLECIPGVGSGVAAIVRSCRYRHQPHRRAALNLKNFGTFQRDLIIFSRLRMGRRPELEYLEDGVDREIRRRMEQSTLTGTRHCAD